MVTAPEVLQQRLLTLLALDCSLTPLSQLRHSHLGTSVAEDLSPCWHEPVSEESPECGVDLLLGQVSTGSEHHKYVRRILGSVRANLNLEIQLFEKNIK